MDYKQRNEGDFESAKAWYKIVKEQNNQLAIEILERLFPSLKESEDERIKKNIISWLKNIEGQTIPVDEYNSALAWLEKQSEQETLCDKCRKAQPSHSCQDITALGRCYIEGINMSTNKVEPKFKVGDWITDGYVGGQITSIEDNYPCYKIADFMGGINTSIPFSLQDNYHLWTIEDAKPGDVLYCKSSSIEYIVMNKGVNDHGNIDSYFRYNSLNGFGVDIPSVFSTRQDDITPSTKEQRDLLFQKMKEAGYEWNAEKKELKKIHVIDEGKVEMDYCFTKMMNGEKVSPAWSEEDEKNWRGIIDEIKANKSEAPDYDIKTYDRFLSWLKSLKQRIYGAD